MPNVFEQAIQVNNSDKVHQFLTEGKKIPVDIRNRKSQTGLMVACEFKASKCAKKIINKKSDLEAHDTSGWRPIHFAAKSDCLEIVKILIEKGAKIDAENNNEETALHIATANNFADIVKMLINEGANIDSENNKGDTALHIAAKHNFADIVDCLLDNKANENENFQVPLEISIVEIKIE